MPAGLEVRARLKNPLLAYKDLKVGNRKGVSRPGLKRAALQSLVVAASCVVLFVIFRKNLVLNDSLLDQEGSDEGLTRRFSDPVLVTSQHEHGQKEGIISTLDDSEAPSAEGQLGESTSSRSPGSHGLYDQEQHPAPQNDAWGLPSLVYFESTLQSRLRRGREAIAAWVARFNESRFLSGSANKSQRLLAEALSSGASDSLVGMTVVLRDVHPLNWSDKSGPQMLRIKKVVDVLQWNLVAHAEDTRTGKTYTLHIPVIRKKWVDDMEVALFLHRVREAATAQIESSLQACGNLPAEFVANQKGFAIPVYSTEIVGMDPAFSARDSYIFNRVVLMEKFQGNLAVMKSAASSVMLEAREYIASRLLQIVLKLEQSGVGHISIDWSSLFLRDDGTFLLGNFVSASPFGKPTSELMSAVSNYPDPNMVLQSQENGICPTAGSNLWTLGVLLFELYTGDSEPFGSSDGPDWEQQTLRLSEKLLKEGARSEVLASKLDVAKTPTRWKQLIMRLLEPSPVYRITGFEVVREFSDLLQLHPQ